MHLKDVLSCLHSHAICELLRELVYSLQNIQTNELVDRQTLSCLHRRDNCFVNNPGQSWPFATTQRMLMRWSKRLTVYPSAIAPISENEQSWGGAALNKCLLDGFCALSMPVIHFHVRFKRSASVYCVPRALAFHSAVPLLSIWPAWCFPHNGPERPCSLPHL